MSSTPTTDSEILSAWDRFRVALEDGDVDALRELLDEDFVLGHMTGQRQPRQEWLDDIASGAAVYHSIENIEIAVEVDGGNLDTAVVTAHTMADVTIGGERGTWRTEFRTAFRKRAGRWVAARTDGGSW